MNPPGALPPSRLVILAASCGSFGIMAWVLWVWVFAAEPAQDWMVFYTAARAYFDGNLPLIFDGQALTAALNQRFAGWLAMPLHLHPWVYPPSFLVLFAPFGMLPPFASLVVFLASGFIALGAAASLHVGRGQRRWIVAFSLVLCPAVPFNVMTGQNAFFTSALLVGGFGLLTRYPVLAGALLGILTFKPQLWLMVPVALLAARQWRALGSATASALAVALLSLALFGPEIWRVWFALMRGTDEAYRAWVASGRLNGISVFACVAWLGASPGVANLAQWTAIAIAAAFVYQAFRRPQPGALELAVLLAATMLAAPHVSTSDAVLLALATSLFVAASGGEGPRPAHLMLAAAVWIIPLFNPPSVFRPGSVTPLLIVALLLVILARIREAGTPQPAAPDRSA
ncbi:MAG TPA: glycosyltransferase family 87 protein [Stellaceae bacterium]|nr:glycosyltransferase family 87 protein [Stellaceae bacterium]